MWIVALVPAPTWPQSFASVPLATFRSVFDNSLPLALFSVPATLAISPFCALIEPDVLSNVAVCATTRPLLAIEPPTFDIEPVPLPSVNLPVPACVIVPPSFTSEAGASMTSVLLVCSVPLALSSVPETLTRIAPVPVCVIVPPWFARSTAVSET
ncbi:hypothetical protein BUGL105410_27760 [Burkholderia gladioli]